VPNPPREPAERLVLFRGSFAGGTAVRPDNGAVDHLQLVQCSAAVCERLKHQVPDARFAPTAELLPHGVAFAELCWEIAPWHSRPAEPEYAVQFVPVVFWWTPATRAGRDQERSENRPLIVGHQSAEHSRPQVYQEAGQDWLQAALLNPLMQKSNGPNPEGDAPILFGTGRGTFRFFPFRSGRPINPSPRSHIPWQKPFRPRGCQIWFVYRA